MSNEKIGVSLENRKRMLPSGACRRLLCLRLSTNTLDSECILLLEFVHTIVVHCSSQLSGHVVGLPVWFGGRRPSDKRAGGEMMIVCCVALALEKP